MTNKNTHENHFKLELKNNIQKNLEARKIKYTFIEEEIKNTSGQEKKLNLIKIF